MTGPVEMVGDRTIFDEPHHQSLELLAAQALAASDTTTAFKLADRRCRIVPTPEAHCYLLRGEASYSLGATPAAVADLAKALEVAPDDIAANRRMLAWGDRAQQLQAALSLVRYDNNLKSVRDAAQILTDNGHRNFAKVTVFADHIEGWAVWHGNSPLLISIADNREEITQEYEGDAFHPLAQYGAATSFRMRRPQSMSPQTVLLSAGGTALYAARTAGNKRPPRVRVIQPRPPTTGRDQITVIVPIYGDFDATRLCLETLLDALKVSGHRAILIDDETPEPRIAEHLAQLATDPRIELIVNARNLGFVGSVNRALDCIKQGDVILLNSDTVVPRDFIERLAAAAHAWNDIGTVTPLSNNGEFVSFPVPFRANPLGSREEVERINATAAKANAEIIVDIPSGIGFCLYVTRACLDRVGPLSEHFERGYLEDVDLCLRAREQGFRNVCAPSVYVGHEGSKSFGGEKRALVVRNLRLLERRFPYHRSECAAFMDADPLRPARQAIEQSAAAIACNPRLFVTGAGAVGSVAKQRAGEVASTAEPVLILEVHYPPQGPLVKLLDAAGAIPQSLQFRLFDPNERKALSGFIKRNRPSRIEFFDPTNTPPQLVDLLLKLKIPYDLFIADAGVLGRNDQRFCAAAAHGCATSEATAARDRAASTAAQTRWIEAWRRIAAGAQRILAPSPEAEAFAASVLPGRKIDKTFGTSAGRRRPKRRRPKATSPHLGLLPVRLCASEQRLMCQTARHLRAKRPDVTITVLGATLDDIGLMRASGAFVTGPIEPQEFSDLADALGIDHLFISATQPIFGHPILSRALSLGLPTASFDWCGGRKVSKHDLSLDPHLPQNDLMGALLEWLPKSLITPAVDDRH